MEFFVSALLPILSRCRPKCAGFLPAKKVTAAQLTYNRTTGEWASTDRAALRDPFEWFVKFFLWLSGLLGTEGLSCTV